MNITTKMQVHAYICIYAPLQNIHAFHISGV